MIIQNKPNLLMPIFHTNKFWKGFNSRKVLFYHTVCYLTLKHPKQLLWNFISGQCERNTMWYIFTCGTSLLIFTQALTFCPLFMCLIFTGHKSHRNKRWSMCDVDKIYMYHIEDYYWSCFSCQWLLSMTNIVSLVHIPYNVLQIVRADVHQFWFCLASNLECIDYLEL